MSDPAPICVCHFCGLRLVSADPKPLFCSQLCVGQFAVLLAGQGHFSAKALGAIKNIQQERKAAQ